MWFPWRSARSTADLYITATQATRLGRGMPVETVQIEGADGPDGLAPMQELIKPFGQRKNVRLWLGASLLQAGVLPPTSSALKESDLQALVAAELAERMADPIAWKIAATQQADRSILWCASDQIMVSAVHQLLTAFRLNLISVAPVWSLADGRSITAATEALLWWREVDALTGINLKDGVVQAIAIAPRGSTVMEDASERLRVRLAAGEQVKEFAVCLAPATDEPAMAQDLSPALLPESWHVLRHRERNDPASERKAA